MLGRRILGTPNRGKVTDEASVAQIAVCSRHHTVDKQLRRWLLLSLDHLPSNALSVPPWLALRERRRGNPAPPLRAGAAA